MPPVPQTGTNSDPAGSPYTNGLRTPGGNRPGHRHGARGPTMGGFGVATGSNDTGAGGFTSSPQATAGAKGSRVWNVSIAAGATFPIAQSGKQFFVIAASAVVAVRVPNGTFSTYSTNQKVVFEASFAGLEVQNPNTFPVSLSLWVGWDDFTSYQFTLQDSVYVPATYATAPTPQTFARILIPDLSGQAFTAADGSKQIAFERSMILISNVDPSTGLWLQGGLTSSSNSGGVLFIPAGQSLQFSSGGNFCLTINNVTNVNASVSEIYSAIPVNGL